MAEENKTAKKEGKKKITTDKDMEKKLKDLKIELLKQTQKRKSIKKEIARILTAKNKIKLNGENK